MNLKPLLVAVIAAALFLAGCDRGPTEDHSAATSTGTGRLTLQVRSGAIGILARASAMNPTRIAFEFTSDGEHPVLDTFSLSSNSLLIRDLRLGAGRIWHMTATGLDQRDSILYQGQQSFPIGQDSTTNVILSMEARYSSLRLRFPVKDGARRFQSQVDGSIWLDTTLPATGRANDTVLADRDYLGASPSGTEHRLGLRVSGNRGDKDTVLFALDTTLLVKSGVSAGVRLTLRWVGAQIPPSGSASFEVTLGTVGELLVDLDYHRPQAMACPQWQDETGIAWNESIDYGILCDQRDGQAYRTVQMGTQTWMAEGLNYSGESGTLGACAEGVPSNCSFSGRIYRWSQAMAIGDEFQSGFWPGDGAHHQGICPDGWRIPTVGEWRILLTWVETNAVGLPNNSLITPQGWRSDFGGMPMSGSDQFGFHALPKLRGTSNGIWWATGNSDPAYPNQGDVFFVGSFGMSPKSYEGQVRCIRD